MFTGPYDTGTDPAFTHGPSYAPDGGYPAHSMVASGATSIRRTPTKKDVERAHKMTNLPNAGQAQHAIHQMHATIRPRDGPLSGLSESLHG